MSKPIPVLLYYVYRQNMMGGARVVLNLSELLDRERYVPIVVSQKESRLTREARKRGVETVVLPLPPALDVYEKKALDYPLYRKVQLLKPLLAYNRRVQEVAEAHGAGIIWARNIRAVLQVGIAAKRLGIPLIWDIALADTSRPFMRLLHSLGLLGADRVVTEAASQHEELFGALGARLFRYKLQTINPGIDARRMAALKDGDRTSLPPGDKPSEDRSVILTVGTLEPRKNQLMLLRALKTLVPRHPRLLAWIVGPSGDEAYRSELQDFVQETGLKDHVAFLGWREDIPRLMQRADIFAMSSRNEGIPYVVHEAMHTGLPIVGTEAGGMPDAIRHGETGYVAPVDDVERYAAYLGRCLDDAEVRQAMGRAARARAEKHFTAASWAANYQRLLDTLT